METTIMGLFWDDGKGNGNYYNLILGLEFRSQGRPFKGL